MKTFFINKERRWKVYLRAIFGEPTFGTSTDIVFLDTTAKTFSQLIIF